MQQRLKGRKAEERFPAPLCSGCGETLWDIWEEPKVDKSGYLLNTEYGVCPKCQKKHIVIKTKNGWQVVNETNANRRRARKNR